MKAQKGDYRTIGFGILKSALIVIIMMIGVSTFAETISKSGKCTLQEAGAFDKNKIVVVDLKNDEIQIQFNLRGSNFFGKFVIQTTPNISNLTKESKHIAYNIAFFDKNEKLIACTSSSTNIDPNEKNLQTGSNMPEIPRKTLDAITSYQVVVYISKG